MNHPNIPAVLALLFSITLFVQPGVRAADLLVGGSESHNVIRFDGKTGARIGAFVPSGSGGLAGTHGMAFGSDGNLYVNNRYRHNILRFNGKTGEFIDVFVPAGSGGLDTNIGLVFGPDNHLYVACHYTNQVLRYDGATGAFIDVFVPSGSGGLSRAGGLEFGPDGNLYVSSGETHSVLCYDGKTGAFLRPFVAARSGGLEWPVGLLFAPDGSLYVGSYHTNSVLRYHGTTGAFLGTVVPPGSGGLNRPVGLRFGPEGDLFVVSELTHSVLRYEGRTGTFLGTFATGELNRPTWLVFSPPEAPTELTAVPAGSQVRLTWNDNSDDEEWFEIERRAGTGPFFLLDQVASNVTSLQDTTISPGVNYTYRVRAVGSTGRSAYSNSATVAVFVGGRLRVRDRLVLPSTQVGGTSAQTLFISNAGSGPLAGTVQSLSSPFFILAGGGPFVLGPGQRKPVVIGFSPVAAGEVISTLVITSTDRQQPGLYVQLVGVGTLEPDGE